MIWAVTYRGVLRVIGKKGPEYIHDDVLALTPEPSRDGNHLIAVGLNGRLNIIDVAKRSPVLKYGFEGVPPKVFGATGGLVMAHIDGTTRNMRVQRIRGWS